MSDEMRPTAPVRLDVTHTTLAVIFIGGLLASTFWILRPFLMSILWAALIVIATWPTMEKLQALLGGKRGLAVTIMTLAILLVVLVPLTLAVLTIIDHAEGIVAKVQALSSTALPAPPQWLERIPFAGEKIAAKWRESGALSPEERVALMTPYTGRALQWFVDQAGSVGMTLVQFLLTTIIAAIMYANGETVRSGILSFARRLAGSEGEAAAVLAGKAARSVALGVVVTAIVQTALGGVGLFIAQVPGASLLTAVMFMLCLAQVGAGPVLIPAVIWLYLEGQHDHGDRPAGLLGPGPHDRQRPAPRAHQEGGGPAADHDLRRRHRRSHRLRGHRALHRSGGLRDHVHAAQVLGGGGARKLEAESLD